MQRGLHHSVAHRHQAGRRTALVPHVGATEVTETQTFIRHLSTSFLTEVSTDSPELFEVAGKEVQDVQPHQKQHSLPTFSRLIPHGVTTSSKNERTIPV